MGEMKVDHKYSLSYPLVFLWVFICWLMKDYTFPHGIQKVLSTMSNIPRQHARPRAPKFMHFPIGYRWWPKDSPASPYGLKEILSPLGIEWGDQSQNAFSALVIKVSLYSEKRVKNQLIPWRWSVRERITPSFPNTFVFLNAICLSFFSENHYSGVWIWRKPFQSFI
jgi:hypothetical protein